MPSRFYPPSAEMLISAPISTVWDVLLDGSLYPEWNSFIFEVTGDLSALQTPIAMQVRLGRQVTRPFMRVVTVEPPEEAGAPARWVHQYADRLARIGWLTSERHHEMRPVENGAATVYKTWESFGGWMRRFVPYRAIDAGFKLQAEELKARAEAIFGAGSVL